ncbi:hypothetical protein U7230_14200 [Carboxydochorda subterranea]|uniref:Uncharacterized protein n=1 Tax=Carboxydichorda subterranea TaxID=3109565 RepID=A0ABZ1BWP3_9FIRM|nr:hypothetical protein [Limnochorda sp. L945t]WRP17215.1 hypothetical protein U7230_14200 [Limnochorda sp. L945t]
MEGRLSWEFLLVPSGAVIKWLLPAGGVAVVDATTQEKNTRLIQQPMRPAEGVYLRGIVDALFIHQDQVKVTEVSRGEDGPVNRQPFLMANPLVDWSGFEIIEPLPFVRDGVLYWKVVVMPKDAAGIAYQAFVDSRTNRVYTVQSDIEQLLGEIRERLDELEVQVDLLKQAR